MRDMPPGGAGDAVSGAGRWQAACRVALLSALDPPSLGGVWLRARPGPAVDRWLAVLRDSVGAARVIKVPAAVPDDRLIGGLDIAATLAAGRPVLEPGLLPRANGGVIVVTGADRLSRATAARIAASLDDRAVRIAREGMSAVLPSDFGVVLMDEGEQEDGTPPEVLLDRMAFRIDLGGLALADLVPADAATLSIKEARARLADVVLPDPIIAALCEAGAAFGVASPRATLLAARAARAIAALSGKAEVDAEAAREAAVLVLGPRALTMPAPPDENRSDNDDEDADQEPPAEPPPENGREANPPNDIEALTESVIEAVQAALPTDLLASLMPQRTFGGDSGGRAPVRTASRNRGRQIGVRRGSPRGGARLDILATLRAAAPWQRLRSAQRASPGAAGARIAVRGEDFRVRKFEDSSGTLTIFVVDASGSAALHRLGEAKGAVELLLADCYVRRDSVALIAFRGRASALELPPTRSLTRAKRTLAGLPGGGGTPLAHALLAAGALANDARRRGVAPAIVLLTDCRSNIALDGTGGRARAEDDAIHAAKALAGDRQQVLLVDTSTRPQPFAAVLRAALRARYLALPHSDVRKVATAARTMIAEPATKR